MLTDKISEKDLAKYNDSSRICRIVITELISKIQIEDELNVYDLIKYSNQRIEEECNKIYKKEINKGIAFPTSISLNNCVGNYIYEKDNHEYNIIKEGDVVKIELGVTISGCIIVLGETIIKLNKQDNINGKYDEDSDIKDNIKYITFLNDLKDDIVDMIKVDELNDEIRIHIESKCVENYCFPIQNTTSYQHLDGQLHTDDSKYIILNYKNTDTDLDDFDKRDTNIKDNFCFEFEDGEVYTIHLVISKSIDEDVVRRKCVELHEPHIYRFNDYFYNLKLKMSREFCSIVKKKHSINAFDCLPYKEIGKYRVGIKEASEHNILEKYPILYDTNNVVFHKKFTILVGKDRTKIL
jgi:methionine aminopeptidase